MCIRTRLNRSEKTYHIAMTEVFNSEFGKSPASKTKISNAQYSKLKHSKEAQITKHKIANPILLFLFLFLFF